MATPDPATAFSRVDDTPEPEMLVRGMDETARWEAVRELRAQTAAWLAVAPGASILDVGCGPGDVVIDLARAAGPSGRAVGIDASAVMLAAARQRAADAGVTAEFEVGDAQALAFADDTFDASRSERTFQWLADPTGALAEMIRVTRPGGMVVVIDSDWETLAIEHPQPDLTRRILDWFAGARPGASSIGRRMRAMFRRAGLEDITMLARAAVLEWDPDASPGPPGLPPMPILLSMATDSGVVSSSEAEAWGADAARAARDGEFCGSLTLYAVGGRKPARRLSSPQG